LSLRRRVHPNGTGKFRQALAVSACDFDFFWVETFIFVPIV